jgi:hypothetical protein
LEVARTYNLNHSFALAVARQANINLNTNLQGVIQDSLIEIDYKYHSYRFNSLLDTAIQRNPKFFDVVEGSDLQNLSVNELKNYFFNRIVLFAHVGSGNASNRYDIEDRHLTPHENEDIIHKAAVSNT